MSKAKEILDKHLKLKNLTNDHIHVAAYMSCLDAVNEALNLDFVVKSLKDLEAPAFDCWLKENYRHVKNKYYSDVNGIWKKHNLFELYEDIYNL